MFFFIVGQLLFDNLKLQGSAQVKSLNRVTLHSNYLNKIPPVSDLTNLHVLDLDNLFIPVDINVKNVNGEDFDDFLKSLVMKNMNTEIPGNITLDGVSTKSFLTEKLLINVFFTELRCSQCINSQLFERLEISGRISTKKSSISLY